MNYKAKELFFEAKTLIAGGSQFSPGQTRVLCQAIDLIMAAIDQESACNTRNVDLGKRNW